MAVADLISLFESIDSVASPQNSSRLSYQLSTPANMKLSLQTIFNPKTRSRRSPGSSPLSSSRSSSRTPYPQTPITDLNSYFSSPSSVNSSPSSTLRGRMRRQPSAIDMILEEERAAEGPEHIGLGLMEPRPRASTASTIDSACSLAEFMTESQPAPVVLDGIFEVLESA
jgi:hypothetical protein